MATVKKPTGFDLKLFEQMQEPISIRIERKNPRTGQMEPIPLPQDVWAKEDARRIENIILKDVSGGGNYKGQMIGAAGKTMEWTFAYPTQFYPELIPPGSADALGQGGSPSMPQPAVGGTAAAIPPWQSGLYGHPVSPPAATPIPGYQRPGAMPPQMSPMGFGFGGYPPMPPYNPYGFPPPYQAPPPPVTSTSRSGGKDPELDMLRQQMQASQRQADEERHAREREAQAAAFREQLASQQQKADEQIRQLREMMIDGQKRTRPEDDPAIQTMRQQNEMLQKQMEEQRRQLEQTQAEARHREEMRQLQENSQRQIDALKDLVTKMGENKTDPMIMSLIEMQRGQMDVAREASRQQAESTREQSRLAAEQPRLIVDMMSKMREASGGEQMLSNIASAYSNVNQMQMQVMEMLMNSGQSPGIALAEGALASGKEVLERYLMAKRDNDLAAQRTQQVTAQAQAAAVQAQAYYAQQQQAQAVYRDENGSIVGQPPARDQLVGDAMQGTVEGVEEAQVEAVDAEGVEVVDSVPPTVNTGPKEAAIFGPLYDHVKQLRMVVQNGDAGPEAVAQVIIEAIFEIDKQGVTVPAFTLVLEDRFAELIDLLLPSVSSDFAGETIQHLQKKLSDLGVDFKDDAPQVIDVEQPQPAGVN